MKSKSLEAPVVIEEVFNFSKSTVWDAITNIDKMKLWFFSNIPSFKPEIGFQTAFIVRSGDRNFTHLWKIIEVIPGTLIKYQWSYEEYPGEGTVTFLISEKDVKTKLSLTNEGLETFPQSLTEFKRENCEAGWRFFIGQLKAYLEKGS